MALIEARGVEFTYRTAGEPVAVLSDVSFTIEAGDYVAIQGPSGSGKSTLFYILGCLLKPTGGQVLLNGVDLGKLSDAEASVVRNRRIGFVFQQFHLLPRATVLANILMPAAYPTELPRRRHALRQKARDLATRLGLGAQLDRLPNQLSGGQQQRVAIARALVGDVDLILADEPTGNLDSKTAEDILGVFAELNAQGKTIVVITHDAEVARRARRVLHCRDGRLTEEARGDAAAATPSTGVTVDTGMRGWSDGMSRLAALSLPGALDNLVRNRAKSLLTMLGIIIGIAAVLAMITLGQFTKRRILEGFEALGVNRLSVYGYSGSGRKATDQTSVTFSSFDYDKDLVPLRRIFPEIGLLSPVLMIYNQITVTAGGRSFQEGVRLLGVNHEYFAISNARIVGGRPFTPYHVEERAPVCVLGDGVVREVFGSLPAVGQLVTITLGEERAFPCQVIGVLAPQKSNKEWFKPDLQVLVPYTTLQGEAEWWSSMIRNFSVQIRPSADVETMAKKLKAYFVLRYGKGGTFGVDTDGTLVAQMKRFLNIFAALLAAIAFLSLLVGGIGIHNMMLVSVTERIKEIGLRKALGATSRSIKVQVLMESVVLCGLAGLFGIATGFAATEVLIWAATKLVPNLKFEWVIDPWALAIATGSIAAVGLMSGMVPAMRAERLEVIEALRAE